MNRYKYTIKQWCFAGLLGIGLMNVPGMAHVLWLGNARSNVLLSKEYINLSGLLPVINRDRSILWFEADIVEIGLLKGNYKNTVDNVDVGIAGRFVWTPQLIIGGYLFANTNPSVSLFDLVKLEEAFEINPGIELIWPHYHTSFHLNGIWLWKSPEMRDKDGYYKWSWKIERLFSNRLKGAIGTYHTQDKASQDKGLSALWGITTSITYVYNANWNGFLQFYYDWQAQDPPTPWFNIGVQWKIGKTEGFNDPVKRYLRQPLDRYIAPVKPFKPYNYDRRRSAAMYASQSDSDTDSGIELKDTEAGAPVSSNTIPLSDATSALDVDVTAAEKGKKQHKSRSKDIVKNHEDHFKMLQKNWNKMASSPLTGRPA